MLLFEQKKARAEAAAKWRAKRTPEEKQVQIEENRSRRTKRKALFNALKSERGCYDCGAMLPAECLDWDHRPGTVKSFGISEDCGRASLERVIEEINKCDVVCSNCHRLRTKQRLLNVTL
jgi:hypothetical protein